jgi:hypothetical protein
VTKVRAALLLAGALQDGAALDEGQGDPGSSGTYFLVRYT